ncbi:lytic transglycosylase domain-containing protein [Pseudomonas sp. GD03842]|uniref:lytic transglycosylase domain-containing protein n=1 Tax=Pseudomonas sp. GD03842 TaxID=2975385 RepID=UPI0024473BE4|nr:lytic transglycosylase domain-containing protein [Pseudomonas sp. GD03842]MDH0745638.1 lytic transglycosylase domain-containing protein [Pseudomonas sp. GD03842]
MLFANAAQPSQVNFAPPNSQDPQVNASNALTGNNAQNGIMQQILTLLMELMQLLKQNNPNAQPNAQNLAAQNSGGGGGGGGAVDNGGGGGGVEGGGSGVNAPASNAARGVTDDTAVSGSGDLHLPKQLEPYRSDILDASNATGVPANILAGQIWAESRGQLGQDTTNVNGKTDAGLMQVNADTFAGLKKENPDLLGNADVNNVHDNIMAGALYMRDQHQAFGDWGSALRAYNSGPDKVVKGDLANVGGVGDPNYVDNVMNFAKIIESGQGQLPA